MRTFSGTFIAFAIAACLSWVWRLSLLELWLAPLLSEIDVGSGLDLHYADQAGVFVATLRVVVATTLLVTVPVFSAEVWLLACRKAQRVHARRLTVPFAAMSAGAMLLSLWLARRVVLSSFVMFL